MSKLKKLYDPDVLAVPWRACKNLKPIQEMARELIVQLELCTKEANNRKVYM
jgi:hypothetical protein